MLLFFIQSQQFFLFFEGKNIWHFDSKFSDNRYWIKESEIRKEFLEKKVKRISLLEKMPKDLCNDYETYRLAIRKISSNTNERTLTTTILPKNFLTGNSLTTHFPFKHDREKYAELRYSYSDLIQLTTLLNSYVADYILRARVTTNLNTFYLYQLPLPRLKTKDKWYKAIVERAAKLICKTEEFADLWEDVMKTKWNEKAAATNDEERNTLRAELDGIIAHLYGLTEEEFKYILSTFPIVKTAQKELAFAEYKLLIPQFVKVNTTEITISDLIQKGENPVLEFKSTLRVDIKTYKAEKFIEHSVIKTLAAFLNSAGGTLLIGVEDNKNLLGLELDFNSFSKADKLDEFQKHFDNLISKTLGNRFQRYLKVEFPEIDGKTICSVTIKEKSEEPVYITNDAGQETFYIRRQASTIDLKPSETVKYIKEHWK